MNKKKKDILFLITTVLLCLLLFGVKLTGTGIHTIFGFLLIIITLFHVYKNRHRIKYMAKNIKWIDGILIGSVVVMFVSGMVMHFGEMKALTGVHALAGVAFCVCVLIHVAQHRIRRKETVKNVS